MRLREVYQGLTFARNVNQVLAESNRGIIGTVIDTQAGKPSAESFTDGDGTVWKATQAWKFPADDRTLKYQYPTLKPSDINQLRSEFAAVDPDQDISDRVQQIAQQKSLVDLQLIASSDINVLSDKIAEHLRTENQPTEYEDADQQFARELMEQAKLDTDTVLWVNDKKPQSEFAALVVELTSDTGRQWVGKYYKKKQTHGHIFWQVKTFINDLKEINIQLQRKAGATSQAVSQEIHLGPKALGITDKVIHLSRLATVVARGAEANSKISEQEKQSIVGLIRNLGRTTTTINPEYRANYETQLGEVVAPLAICKGINVTGDIDAAETQMVNLLDPGVKFAAIQKVEYPDNIAEKLVDSYLITPNGSKIGVSSKNKEGGAAASISGIIETINNKLDVILERVPDFETRYAQHLRWLKIISASTGKTVAFNLAVAMRIISRDVARQALAAMENNPADAESLKAIDGGNYYRMTIDYPGYSPKTQHPMYRIHYHATASLARMVAEKFNQDQQKTNEFFATVLESSNMIQVLATLGGKDDQASFDDFKVIYPPVFEGDIKLLAGSYFYAQKEPMGFTFKVPKK